MDKTVEQSEKQDGKSLDPVEKATLDNGQTPADKGSEKPTMEDALKERFNELHPESSQDEVDEKEEKAPESDSKIESDKKEEEKVDKEKEPPVDEKDGEDEEPKGPVPLERFQEVTSENRELKAKVASYEPAIEAHQSVVQFCQQNGLTSDDFTQALQMAALLKQDPAKFAEAIEPMLEGIGVYRGDKLPEDLQKKVDEGTMELVDAKEMASLRAQKQFGESKVKLTQQQVAQREAAQLQQQTAKAMSDWRSGKQKEYPDFKRKADGKPDGFFEQVDDKISALMQQQNADGSWKYPIRGPQDAVNLMETAFKMVSETIKGYKPRKAPSKHLSSNGSATTSSNKDPLKAKTMEDAIRLKFEELGGTV
jgi:hypothetical protein